MCYIYIRAIEPGRDCNDCVTGGKSYCVALASIIDCLRQVVRLGHLKMEVAT